VKCCFWNPSARKPKTKASLNGQLIRSHYLGFSYNPLLSIISLGGTRQKGTSRSQYDILQWQLPSRHPTHSLTGHTDIVSALTRLPEGLLASGSHDRSIRLWRSAEGGPALATLFGHTMSVSCLATLPSNPHSLVSGGDRTVRVWDLTRSSSLLGIQVLNKHTEGVQCIIGVTPHCLASGAGFDGIIIWDVRERCGARVLQVMKSRQTVYSLAVLSGGVLAWTEGDDISLWI